MRCDAWIRTRSGTRFDFLAPDPASVRLFDIAHALAQKPRWTGHGKLSPHGHAFSVAQHSVFVSDVARLHGADAMGQLHALIHDAAEAYMPDVASPQKARMRVVGYDGFTYPLRDVEECCMGAIRIALGVPDPTWAEVELVKLADLTALVTEARVLMGDDCSEWPNAEHLPEPVEYTGLVGMPIPESRHLFMTVFDRLRTEAGIGS